MQKCTDLFNINPEKGLKLFIQYGLFTGET